MTDCAKILDFMEKNMKTGITQNDATKMAGDDSYQIDIGV